MAGCVEIIRIHLYTKPCARRPHGFATKWSADDLSMRKHWTGTEPSHSPSHRTNRVRECAIASRRYTRRYQTAPRWPPDGNPDGNPDGSRTAAGRPPRRHPRRWPDGGRRGVPDRGARNFRAGTKRRRFRNAAQAPRPRHPAPVLAPHAMKRGREKQAVALPKACLYGHWVRRLAVSGQVFFDTLDIATQILGLIAIRLWTIT